MIEYRTYLTGLVAVFLALGLGMLVGSALVGAPSSERQQRDLRSLQQNFAQFSQRYTDLRSEADNVKGRLQREDQAVRELMPSYLAHKLAGQRVSMILCGELDDTAFVAQMAEAIETAGGTVVNTTRFSDDWLPTDDTARTQVVRALGLPPSESADWRINGAVARAIALGRGTPLSSAAQAASGLRLDGDYSRSVDCILVISGTQSPTRFNTARVRLTPEAALVTGLSDTPVRVVAAETDGDDALSTLPYLARSVAATVDNIDMASGQISAVYALAGRDGHFGIKRTAERAIPETAE